MAKNGHFDFFLTIFPKKTGINSEWQKMAILTFFQQFSPKRLVQIQNGPKWPFQIFSNNFSQKDWYKFGMAKNGCSESGILFLLFSYPCTYHTFL